MDLDQHPYALCVKLLFCTIIQHIFVESATSMSYKEKDFTL